LKTVVGDEIKLTENPIVLRYKGKVPVYWLIPHIFCMFFGFWFAVRTGMEAVAKRNNLYKLTLWTTILLFFGGIILGPVIQKYAFGAFWTGWPFGHDLTDNKTLVAFIMWVVALWKMRKNKADRKWAIIAALVTLAVFIVPHSVLGSEIDYTKIQKP
jgi:di/tricarboxylate transporter